MYQCLPADADKATAFSTGLQLYYGKSLSYACVLARDRTRKLPNLPSTWNTYKALEAFKEEMPFKDAVQRQIELG